MRANDRSNHSRGKVIWMAAAHRHCPEPPSLTLQIMATAGFAASAVLLVYLLTEAIVAWVGNDRGIALAFLVSL